MTKLEDLSAELNQLNKRRSEIVSLLRELSVLTDPAFPKEGWVLHINQYEGWYALAPSDLFVDHALIDGVCISSTGRGQIRLSLSYPTTDLFDGALKEIQSFCQSYGLTLQYAESLDEELRELERDLYGELTKYSALHANLLQNKDYFLSLNLGVRDS